jgi:glycosyltransferase involved in cell wall biosynthesis
MQSIFKQANQALRNRDYLRAITLYEEVYVTSYKPLRQIVQFNLELVKNRLKKIKLENTDKLEKPENLEEYYFNLIEKGNFFDKKWYLSEYQKKYNINGNPLSHYLENSIKKSLNPSLSFDTRYYLKMNPDVSSCGIHPFIHYVCQGHKENREAKPNSEESEVETFKIETPQYIPRLRDNEKISDKLVNVIAFYLPQFHKIPENDQWWGNGFTEWTNVNPAKPLFEGHYQPHIPDEFLGEYDLSNTNVMHKQVELAKQYGIGGFCFYTYWFSGQRLLEKPVDNFLNDKSIDFPYCICWANENWSRRWDGLDEDILMVQQYSESDDISFIEHMSKYLRDPRYIRIDNKPLLIIYRPSLFPSMNKTAQRWRYWCKNNGIGDIYLAYVQSFEKINPAEYGLDAAIEFPPNNSSPPDITDLVKPVINKYIGKVYDWRVFLKRSEQYENHDYQIFRSVCPSWDNTARKKERGTVFKNSCPKLFEQWVKNAFDDTLNKNKQIDKRLIFVNAWNEWAEGAHLEPDKRYGYAWLQAIRNAHLNILNKQKKIIVVGHDAHHHGAQLLVLNILKFLKSIFHYKIELIILGTGPLLSKYSEYANIHCLEINDKESIKINNLFSNLKTRGFDKAIVNTTVSGVLIPFLKKAGIQTITLVHEMPQLLSDYNLKEQASNIARDSDHIVFPAKQVKDGFEQFLGRSLNKSIIRPQGLYMKNILCEEKNKQFYKDQVRKEFSIPLTSKIIMCSGYADSRKGFDLFIDICKKLIDENSNVYALWVGHGDQKAINKALENIQEIQLKNFIFTGRVEEPQRFYLAADVFALTSREDPFPSVVLEALDALTPVVAFKNSGGFEELINRGCGFLAEKENTIEFSEKIKLIFNDVKLASHMAECGRNIINKELGFNNYIYDILRIIGHTHPKISVIVPNYNYEKYLEERISSIISQSLPIYELIVLDDKSTDKSTHLIKNILKKIENPNTLIENKINSGSVFLQWKRGLEHSSGEYIWIAEADDICKPHLLEKIVFQMQEQNASIGFCDSWQIDEHGNTINDSYKAYLNEKNFNYFNKSFVMNGNLFLKKYLSIKNVMLNASAVVFSRKALLDALNKIGNEIHEYKVAGDWRVYIEICSDVNSKIIYEASPLNGHRRHSNSVTHAVMGEKHLDEIKKIHLLSNKILNLQKTSFAQSKYIDHVKKYLDF